MEGNNKQTIDNPATLQGLANAIKNLTVTVGNGFSKIDQKFEKIDRRFDNMDKKMDERFEDMDKKVDNKMEELTIMVGSGFNEMNQRFENVHEEITGLKTEITGIKTDLTSIKSQMVTKNYLDEKLTDLRGDLIFTMREQDKKVITLTGMLSRKNILTPKETKQIMVMKPFAQRV